MTEFADKLVEESHKKGLTEVQLLIRKVMSIHAKSSQSTTSYAITEFPGSFEGWALIYARVQTANNSSSIQIAISMQETHIKAMEQYNKLNKTHPAWPEG